MDASVCSGLPAPNKAAVLIHGEGVRPDRVDRYDEFACAEGGLCRISGCDILPILLDLIDKAHKYGD